MMSKRDYDFAGWVTKNDIRCSDGVVIKKDAFKDSNGTKVPLVWNHNYSSPNNVLGHMILQSHDGGTYGYGYFNETDEAQNAKEMVKHGDITSMSIGARQIKRSGADVVHGKIYEVSLVLSGANPGALIDSVIAHNDTGEEEGIVYTGTLIHQADDVVQETSGEDMENKKAKTVGEVLEGMTAEQLEAVILLLENGKESYVDAEDEEDEEDVDYDDDDYEEDSETMKQNIFSANGVGIQEEIITHADQETLMRGALENKVESFKDYISAYADTTLKHGITNIESLFPQAHNLDQTPSVYRDTGTNYKKILDGIRKSPFARLKTAYADFTEEEARAKGYIKGNEKLEQVFSVAHRETTPQTVYKKQKLDRDDIIDITDFDVVAFINKEMRFMLEEELARAALVSDGRDNSSPDKIKEDKIRPIISDDDFYTLKRTYSGPSNFVESVIKAMADYKGSGSPTLYVDPTLLADIKLLKGTDGRWLNGNIPTNSTLAGQMDVKEIVPTTFLKGKGAILVNLNDYTFGSTKGGQITNFDDFDIDFNQYKYLIETRLSGALTTPHSAIHFTEADSNPVEADSDPVEGGE